MVKKTKKKRITKDKISPIEGLSGQDYNRAKGAIKNAIRREFSRSRRYKKFLEDRKVHWKSGNRKRVSYKCNDCNELFSGDSINVDHINPIGHGTFERIEDCMEYFLLVYCSEDNLQVLCHDCHNDKTSQENNEKSYHNALF